jgi:hypothetical protein
VTYHAYFSSEYELARIHEIVSCGHIQLHTVKKDCEKDNSDENNESGNTTHDFIVG